MQKIKETGDSRDTYDNKLEKACFQQDIAFDHFKDLYRRTAFDKILCDKTFLTLLKILNMMGIKKVLLHWFIFF